MFLGLKTQVELPTSGHTGANHVIEKTSFRKGTFLRLSCRLTKRGDELKGVVPLNIIQ